MSVGSSEILKVKERVRKVFPYELDEPTWTKLLEKEENKEKTQLTCRQIGRRHPREHAFLANPRGRSVYAVVHS